jgi:protein-tyrosine-phosphatase
MSKRAVELLRKLRKERSLSRPKEFKSVDFSSMNLISKIKPTHKRNESEFILDQKNDEKLDDNVENKEDIKEEKGI